METYCKTVKTCGISEEEVKAKLKEIDKEYFNDAKVEVGVSDYETYISVSGEGSDESDAKKKIKPLVKEIKNALGNSIYSTEKDVTLEKSLVDLLVANELTISVVESCTGGMLSSTLVDVPGVSSVYKMGVVSYSNKAKKKIINVKKSTLDKYGAVSSQTAEEMVKGMSALSKSDVVLSTTGIAGPDGGTDKKPVGLVYVGCFVCGKVKTKECHFSGNRTEIRQQAVKEALVLARECVLKYVSEKMFK